MDPEDVGTRRLKIGMDIDGVLADIVELILPMLAQECGRAVKEEDITCYHFSEALGIPEDRVAVLLEEMIEAGHYEAARAVTGAVEACDKLRQHFVWLITSRPERVREQTAAWLARQGISYHKLVFASPLAKGWRDDGFDLFVEDNLETAIILVGEGIPVLLFDRPWNQHPALPENISRVRDWSEIVGAVERIARKRLSCA